MQQIADIARKWRGNPAKKIPKTQVMICIFYTILNILYFLTKNLQTNAHKFGIIIHVNNTILFSRGKIMWKIIIETRTTEDGISYTAYGVCKDDCSIPDVCTDKAEITRFAELMNRYEVSTINAIDVVEDYLASR